MSDSVRPFTRDDPATVTSTTCAARLRNTRWGDAEVVDDWSQGIPLAYVQEVATYWAEKYDWRAREALLNRFDQFVTEIDGDRHPLPARALAARRTLLPLLLSHGWPGSIVEFQKVIEPLDQSDGVRRRRCRRVPRRGAVVARLRVLGPTDHDGLGSRTHRCRLRARSWRASATRGTSRRAATGAPRSRRSSAPPTLSTAP